MTSTQAARVALQAARVRLARALRMWAQGKRGRDEDQARRGMRDGVRAAGSGHDVSAVPRAGRRSGAADVERADQDGTRCVAGGRGSSALRQRAPPERRLRAGLHVWGMVILIGF